MQSKPVSSGTSVALVSPSLISAALLILAVISISFTAVGLALGFSYAPGVLDDVIVVPLFLVVTAILMLLLAVVVAERKLARDALRRSGQEFIMLAESVPQMVWMTRPDGWNIYFNQQWVDYTGLTLEESFGHGWNKPFHPDDRQRAWDAWREATLKDVPYALECRLRRADGVYRWWLIRGAPRRNAMGEIIKWFGTCTDIEDIKLAEAALAETKALLQAAMDQSSAGIAIAEAPSGKLRYVNRAGLLIRGASEAEALAGVDVERYVTSWKLLHLNGTPMETDEVPLARAVLFGEKCSKEFIIHRSANEDRIVLANAAPILDDTGRVTAGIVVFQDITEAKRAGRELAASEGRFRRAVVDAPFPILIHAEDGAIIQGSDSWYELTGYTREELATIGDWTMRAYGERKALVQADIDALYGMEHRKDEGDYHIRTKSGATRIWDFSSAPLGRLPDGRRLVISMAVDVTERRQAEEFSKAVVASIPGAFYVLDENGLYTRWNTYQRDEIVGKPEELVAGTNALDTIHPDDRALILSKMTNVLENGGEESVEGRVLLRGGPAYRWLLMTGQQMKIEGRPFLVGTGIDITGRKQAEEALRQLNQTLEARVIERTAQLEDSNRELEAFSYSVSHDLRAPLRAMDGFSAALLEDCAGRLEAMEMEHLRRIRAGSQRMAVLIDDLLNLSRETRAEMRRERVDLTALARRIGADLQRAHPDRPTELVVAPNLDADADARMLGVVLTNLLDDAWKFTGQRTGARIEVGALAPGVTGPTAQSPPGLSAFAATVFFVRDNGAGFDMAYADKLFGAFQRLHSKQEFEGTGIGLALVQRIIHRHRGRVWAEGEVGKGATFYFTLGNDEN
jgi:PAS domain S-box-containing protein